jgi:predicted metal-dependent phosphoesterase TrpH
MQLKLDLHVHSHYSYDSLIKEKEITFYVKKRGLDGVAIVDHDRFDGAFKVAKETDVLVVPGMEVTSSGGHIIALNVQEAIPRALGPEETVDKIHDAGGLAVACHPVTFFKGSLRKDVNAKFDAVEVINASAVPFNYSVKHSRRLAERLGAAQVAGTDAHYAPEIGYAYTLVDAEPNVENVVKAISKRQCMPVGRAIPWTLRLKKLLLVYGRRF